MGKNQKKKEPSWRFELHQSVDALVPVPSARGGKKGGGKRSGGGLEERAGAEKPPNGDWDPIDPAVFCELVPTLPRDLVFSVCATERAAGAPVQEALDRLLALSLREEPASSGQGSSSQPTLRVARGVSVRVPQEDAGAPVPRPPVRDGDTHGIAAAVGAARRDLRTAFLTPSSSDIRGGANHLQKTLGLSRHFWPLRQWQRNSGAAGNGGSIIH